MNFHKLHKDKGLTNHKGRMAEAVWNGHTQGMTIRKVIIYLLTGLVIVYFIYYDCP